MVGFDRFLTKLVPVGALDLSAFAMELANIPIAITVGRMGIVQHQHGAF
jgi:hypothetical protein